MPEGRPRNRLTRAEAKARTRSLLLEAAHEVFARKGFSGASVDEIADTAGFSSGALYSNFSGKEELFTELLAGRAQQRVDQMAETIHQTRPEHDDLLRAIGTLVGAAADNDPDTALLQTEFRVQAMRNPELRDKLVDQVRTTRSTLRKLLEDWRVAREAEENRDHTPLPEGIEVIVLALFQGMVEQRRFDPENVPEELYSRGLLWLFAGMRGDEAGG